VLDVATSARFTRSGGYGPIDDRSTVETMTTSHPVRRGLAVGITNYPWWSVIVIVIDFVVIWAIATWTPARA
jgi:hypothetical protein